MGKPVPSDPEGIEHQNQFWWSLREVEKPHTCQMPLDSKPTWPLFVTGEDGRTRQESVESFCYCPLPISGYVRWGFERRADRDRFAALYGATV